MIRTFQASAFVLIAALCGPHQNGPTLLDVAKDRLLVRALYSHPDRMVSHVAPSGAVGANAKYEQGSASRWFIEVQRYGADLVQAGCASNHPDEVEQGWKILGWGLGKQGSDGGFPGTGDPFHSTSFFVEGLARALILQNEARNEPANALELAQKVKRAAHFLLAPEVRDRGVEHNRPYTHRQWLLAAALGETAKLTRDRELAQEAASFAREGIDCQRPDGIDPEKGGGDVNYQALGLLEAGRYALTLANSDPLRSPVLDAIRKGLDWELTKVEGAGDVDVDGSTRTQHEHGRGGELKTVDYKIIVQALTMGSDLTGDTKYKSAAERICRGRGWVE